MANTYSNSIYFSRRSGAIHEYTSRGIDHEGDIFTKRVGKWDYIPWGYYDNLPQENISLIVDNDITPQIIKKNVNFAMSEGIIAYNETVVDGKVQRKMSEDNRYKQFAKDFTYKNVARKIGSSEQKVANTFVVVILNRARKISKVKCIDALQCRIGWLHDGDKTKQMLLVANWLDSNVSESDIKAYPIVDNDKPKLSGSFAIHIKEQQDGFPYYSIVDWEGSKTWKKITNKVPEYHDNGIDKGYNMRFHTQIPQEVIDEICKKTGKKDAEVKKELQTILDDQLTGMKNVGKNVFTFPFTHNGIRIEWKITPLDTKLQDQAYLALHDHATRVHARAHGMHPILTGAGEKGGNLGSGSEIQNLVNMHVKFESKSLRELMITPLEVLQKLGFFDPEEIYWFKDVEFVTQDKDKSGVKPQEADNKEKEPEEKEEDNVD